MIFLARFLENTFKHCNSQLFNRIITADRRELLTGMAIIDRPSGPHVVNLALGEPSCPVSNEIAGKSNLPAPRHGKAL